ncbi:hypothetical protein B0A54_16483 [Friedmanniomyces endolithicus]|uniref:F-box domain-containing protein n=1 Tax=Friedmanniomyces endolithicus TaxID=329885 RepID=A0A4U0TYC1_9PEZI|nr:hypothetical protein LTS09_016744 [Friedmanniomyces endolithicus]TKA27468.1 hypothetical protein B0A54_16483 [Friedmanniomyces endolithicus]
MVSTLTISTPADKLEKNKQPKIGDDMNEAWYQWRKKQTFPLFDLPPELWIRICRFAVVRPTPTVLTVRIPARKFRAKVRQPPITRTCTTVRKETLSHFYAAPFVYEDRSQREAWELMSWLKVLRPKTRLELLDLVIESDQFDRIQYFSEVLGSFDLQLQRAGARQSDGRMTEVFKVVRYREEEESDEGSDEESEEEDEEDEEDDDDEEDME